VRRVVGHDRRLTHLAGVERHGMEPDIDYAQVPGRVEPSPALEVSFGDEPRPRVACSQRLGQRERLFPRV
jgi:hypothetical protein